MHLINGKQLAADIRARVKQDVARLGFTPGLAVILVGDDPASRLYVEIKEKACNEVGIKFEKYEFDATTPQEKIESKIQALNTRTEIHAILIQFPLPSEFDAGAMVHTMAPEKDVDGFHPENLDAIQRGEPRIIPGVSLGILRLVESTGVPLQNKKAALLTNSEEFALPLRYLFSQRGMTITNDRTAADVIVVALGKPGSLAAKDVKDGAIIIDVGTNRVGLRLVGDADVESFDDRDVWITPVPGGVGPLTVSCLLENVVRLASPHPRSPLPVGEG